MDVGRPAFSLGLAVNKFYYCVCPNPLPPPKIEAVLANGLGGILAEKGALAIGVEVW